MRQFELDLEVQRAGALIRDGVLKDTAENRALMDGWRKEIERYKTELKELSDTANGHEADFKRHNETDDLFDFSESFLTLALALLAVAALTRIGWLLGLAAGVGVVGVIFGMAGFLRWGIIRPEWLSMLLGRERPLFCLPDQPAVLALMSVRAAGRSLPSLVLAEPPRDEPGDRLEASLGVLALRRHGDGRALRGAERQDAHDRAPADGLAAAGHGDVGGEALDGLDQFRRGAGVQALAVDDRELAGERAFGMEAGGQSSASAPSTRKALTFRRARATPR